MLVTHEDNLYFDKIDNRFIINQMLGYEKNKNIKTYIYKEFFKKL